MRRSAAALALLAAATAHAAAPCGVPFYDRVDAKMAVHPEIAQRFAKPAPELDALRFMVGEWEVMVRVFATPKRAEKIDHGTTRVSLALDGRWLEQRDTYADGTQELGFFGYDVVSRRFVTTGIDMAGNAVVRTSSAPFADGRLVFAGAPIVVLGETLELRSTLIKTSDDEWRVLNEERLDGAWRPCDEYVYKRKAN